MTTRIRLSLTAGALAVVVAVAAPLLAQNDPGPPQGPPPMGGMRGGPGLRGPMGPGPMRGGPGGPVGLLGDLGPALHQAGVTEDQHAQIKNVLDSHRDEFQAIGERMKAARDGMRAAVEADTIDENAIRAKALEVAAVEADHAILGARVRAEILSLLTAEQLEKVKTFRAEMQKRMEQGPLRRRPGR
ncbi:MAG: Spy/CpxP family protein refolding chaperone [Vicinamibacterales bacterium]